MPRPSVASAAAPTLREWLAEGPFDLGLSAGFFGFFAHCGVVSVLEDAGLVPARVAGASAGALIGGLWASGLDAGRLATALRGLRRGDFWDPAPGLGLLRGRRFRALLDELLVAKTFETAPVRAAVSACDLLAWRTVVLARGALAPAIQASCTFPLLFQPLWLDGRLYADGGILDRHGLAGLPGAGRLLFHHLTSRSPWRRAGSAALAVPARPGMVTLLVRDLPRLGPFRLGRGPVALAQARAAARRALDCRVVDGCVVV
ncbi:MAG TPA: patatin-like phospholipase family protein [Polyangia bacterium]|jgi:NTE family protein